MAELLRSRSNGRGEDAADNVDENDRPATHGNINALHIRLKMSDTCVYVVGTWKVKRLRV